MSKAYELNYPFLFAAADFVFIVLWLIGIIRLAWWIVWSPQLAAIAIYILVMTYLILIDHIRLKLINKNKFNRIPYEN